MMKALIEQTKTVFKTVFKTEPQHIIQAPGRVNLIGEHTDYNDGFVLPCAINYQTVVCCSPRDDYCVNVIAADYDNQQDSFLLNQPIEKNTTYHWANYVRGVAKYIQQKAPQIKGVDMVISGNVPQGSGLSSSASLEVAVGKTLQFLNHLNLTETEIALIGQQAENQFVGCNCGIMDQLISSQGKEQHALLIDCRSLATTPVSLPADSAIMIINSNIKRGLVDSEYNTRRKQCEEAAQILGVKALRDASLADLEQAKNRLDPITYRRARHVIAENGYTITAADALSKGDLKTMGILMANSHASMRDDFEITVPAIDYLVEKIKQEIGTSGGVRMTGGGFGGCVVALIPQNKVDQVKKVVNDNYQLKTGIAPSIYICTATDGVSVIN